MEIQQAIDIVSYKLGLKSGKEALKDKVLNTEIVQKAIDDKEAGNEEKVDLKQYMAATKLLKEHRTELYKLENQAFLAENKQKDGVVTTASGLQYIVLKEGKGAQPNIDDTITVHYQGELIDTKVFDSSIARGEPATFAVKKVIDGWKEGLQLMKEGASFQFFIPQELAYGDRGSGSNVPPYATLIFRVKLIAIG